MKNKYRYNTAKEYVDILTKANDAYYNSEKTILSDPEYDAIRDEFAKRFPKHKFNKVVGAKIKDSFLPKIKHQIPMGSQSKVNSFEELKDWFVKICTKINAKPSLFWSIKLDGFSISNIYENQKLTQSITRGDGIEGEDVTFNVSKIKGAPKELKKNISCTTRGEAIIKKSIFKKNFPDKANPRNTAPGLFRRLDGKGCEHIDFICYDVEGSNLPNFKTEAEKFKYIESLGFTTPKHGVCNSLDEIQKIWNDYETSLRDLTDYEIDGLVICVNEINYQKILGIIDQRPRYSRAYKFSAQRGQTTVLDISWNPGRTGRITPVATLAPVSINGVTITHATLHNISELNKLKITKGALVELKRAGDVIPKIEQLLTPGKGSISIPKTCPACGSPTTIEEKFLMCYNASCDAKHYENLLHWVKTLEIKGFGDELVAQLNEAKLLSTPVDFYHLKIEDISSLNRRGAKSAKKVLDELNSKKEISLPVFIKALGIINFSDKTAELLQPYYPTIESLLKASKKDLLKIHGIGEIVAGAIVSGLKEKKQLINSLLNFIKIKKYSKSKNGKLSGKSFCFTGVRDKNLEQNIIQAGGKISSGVSKELNYLVARDPEESSTKIKKAKEIGVKIITLEQAHSLIN